MMTSQLKKNQRQQKGVMSVEIAYAMPILILVFMSMFFLSDLMLVKNQMSVAVNQSARACANKVNNIEAAQCVTASVDRQLREARVQNRCNVQNRVNVQEIDGVYYCTVSCLYSGFRPIQSMLALSNMFGANIQDPTNLLNLRMTSAFPKGP